MRRTDMKLEHWITQYSVSDVGEDPRPSIANGWPSPLPLAGGYRVVSLTYRYLSSHEMIDPKDKKR